MNDEWSSIKKVMVQILRADNLISANDKKMKKPIKWRVEIISNKKKYLSDFVTCFAGQPYWNNEVEIKLVRNQIEPIVMIVIDSSHNQYGQIIIPICLIHPKPIANGENGTEPLVLQSCELEPTKKCSNPLGSLFYRIYSVEFYQDEPKNSRPTYAKRLSIFGSKPDLKPNRKQSCLEIGSQVKINHYDSEKVPKRLSIFKNSDKSTKYNHTRSKAKSLANIHVIEDAGDRSMSSDSDCENQHYMPPDDIYNQVIRNHGWVRVEDVINDNNTKSNFVDSSFSSHEIEQEKVDVFSVQPDNGPITGNFSVVMEGSNFKSGLFELTYICIDGLEPVDATTCTNILSDTELLLVMPPVASPGPVNIDLELLDGSKVHCSKTFHYIDPTVDSMLDNVMTPREFVGKPNDAESIDRLFDELDEAGSLPNEGYRSLQSGVGVNTNISENTPDNFNIHDRRKLSDYGSQGSFRSDRTSSIRRKIKKPNVSKMELHEEVECLRKEVSELRVQIKEIESTTSVQILSLKCQLESRETEIDNISRTLCNLKMQLLEDGLTKYLELI